MTSPLVVKAARDVSSPLIGISMYQERARWGVWDRSCLLLPCAYAEQVTAAGGLPVLLAPTNDALACLRPLDGLILSGGPDLDPSMYGERAHPLADRPRQERDRWELKLLAAAKSLRRPVLGICRGMQLLNVAHGGTLVQALEDAPGSELHRPAPGTFGVHEVRTLAGSWSAAAVGATATVPTSHHQAVDVVGRGFTPVAWSSDGLVEAIECREGSLLVGVQWHPEADASSPLLSHFVEECAALPYAGGNLPRTAHGHVVSQ